MHPRFPTEGWRRTGQENVIVCPGGPGLITFPRICTSATIIAINPMTTRFPSLAQVGQPRGLCTIGPASNPGPILFPFFFSSSNTRSLDNRPDWLLTVFFKIGNRESPPRNVHRQEIPGIPLIGSSNRVSIRGPISAAGGIYACLFLFRSVAIVIFISWELRVKVAFNCSTRARLDSIYEIRFKNSISLTIRGNRIYGNYGKLKGVSKQRNRGNDDCDDARIA